MVSLASSMSSHRHSASLRTHGIRGNGLHKYSTDAVLGTTDSKIHVPLSYQSMRTLQSYMYPFLIRVCERYDISLSISET